MLKVKEKTAKMVLSQEEEMLERLVRADHAFRRLSAIVDFETLLSPYRALYSDLGKAGIDIEKGFKALLVQFWEDLSDREMEKALQENVAIKWFCVRFTHVLYSVLYLFFCRQFGVINGQLLYHRQESQHSIDE